METIGMAIAAYERTLVSANCAFDRWYFGKQENALTAAAKNGFRLFHSKAGCSGCHTIDTGYALFTDNNMHNTGISYRATFATPSATAIPVAPGESVTTTVVMPILADTKSHKIQPTAGNTKHRHCAI